MWTQTHSASNDDVRVFLCVEEHVGTHAAFVGRRGWHKMMPEVVIAWSLRSLGASKRAVSASISGVRNGITRVDHGYVVHDREVLCDDVDVHGHLVAVRVLLDVQLLVQRRSVLTQRRSLMSQKLVGAYTEIVATNATQFVVRVQWR